MQAREGGTVKTPAQIARECAESLVTLDAYRDTIAAAVEAAISQALAQCPVPSPLSDERLTTIRGLIGTPGNWSDGQVAELLRHIDHLHRVLNGPEAEAIGEAYERGRREGARSQRQADVALTDAAAISQTEDRCFVGACIARDAVKYAPLVTDEPSP